jgi:hypothetical protein
MSPLVRAGLSVFPNILAGLVAFMELCVLISMHCLILVVVYDFRLERLISKKEL